MDFREEFDITVSHLQGYPVFSYAWIKWDLADGSVMDFDYKEECNIHGVLQFAEEHFYSVERIREHFDNNSSSIRIIDEY